MIVNNSYMPVNFAGIKLKKGGIDYVKKECGEQAVDTLDRAIRDFNDTKWKLSIDSNGYSLTSPKTKKTYTGPFSIKKQYKTGASRMDTSRIIIRMDKANRVKQAIKFQSIAEVKEVYNKIKKMNGLEYMLSLLAMLEGKTIL